MRNAARTCASNRWFVAVVLALPFGLCRAQQTDDQPWAKLYTGEEATGANVIALWQFQPGKEAVDNSGNGHDLALRGQARFVPDGKFGSCLESFGADDKNDKAQGALAKDHPDLSPKGAFTLELWVKPKPEMNAYANAFLIDKKYYHYAKDLPQANWDYCLYMAKRGENLRRLVAFLGYGTDSATYVSRDVKLEPGQWVHVAFTYNGAGTGRFFLNGQPVGKTTHEGRGPVTPGSYGVAIGDRHGSVHTGCLAFIDQVRISNGVVPAFSGAIEVQAEGGRTAFVRMEPDAGVRVTVTNDTAQPLTEAMLTVRLGGTETRLPVPELAPQSSHGVTIPVDTTVRPDSYPLALALRGSAGSKAVTVEQTVPVTIVPRTPPAMPVVMWGGGDLPTLKDIGFTHQLIHLVDYAKVWKEGKPTDAVTSGRFEELARSLDEHLANGVNGAVYLYPGSWAATNKEFEGKYNRIDRSGAPREHENVCGCFPEVQTFAYNVGASVAKSFGTFPALKASLIHSEIRDHTSLCFHEHDRQAYKTFSGREIPREAVATKGVQYAALPGFPPNRIVADDDPILTFYRWFWKNGDGWNPLHTAVHKGLKSTGREDLWTFYDPAVRVPSIWGSGGGVSVVSQWTYSYPDPIKLGQATDELFAMAEGGPDYQRVMKMTQIIWYRSQTAPNLPEDESKRVAWEKEIPDARFVTISPDHMREAFWSKISRPIRGIMYHGWGSLVKAGSGSYQFTNPETRGVLTQLVRDVVRPLGPSLLQIADRPSDVALLESFASQMFAGRGSYGWSGSWEADMHLVLQWAKLQPKIVYEETILRDGLDGVRVLVMPNCDVLPRGVFERVAEFQRRGGLIVADENLTPALYPDILVQSQRRQGKADESKAVLQAKAEALRRELDPFYTRYGDSENPDFVLRFRQDGDTDYLFVLNDKRTFGSYVGQHGKVMEKGLPNAGRVTVAREAGYVYDLLAHERAKAPPTTDGLALDLELGPGEGRVYMITAQEIARVALDSPPNAKLGGRVPLRVTVADRAGKAVAAVVPVRLDVTDPKGRQAEFSGYYAAKAGTVSVSLDLAANDEPGPWRISARDLAAGTTAERTLTVSR